MQKIYDLFDKDAEERENNTLYIWGQNVLAEEDDDYDAEEEATDNLVHNVVEKSALPMTTSMSHRARLRRQREERWDVMNDGVPEEDEEGEEDEDEQLIIGRYQPGDGTPTADSSADAGISKDLEVSWRVEE